MKAILHDYQKHAVQHIIDNPASGLLLDMGMGKTLSTLTAIEELQFNYFVVKKVLVIAPLRVAEDTWSREVEKWDHTKHLRVSKILGPLKTRQEALKQDADIYVVNRENVEWLVDQYKKENWPFDMVVIDELSSFKSSKAKRFKALRKVRPFIKRLVGLTGTPAPNSLIDLWPQLYLLDGGERLEKTMTMFRDKYFMPGRRNGNIIYEWRLKQEAESKIHKKISDICISMQAKDYLNLPERIMNIIPIQLDAKSTIAYRRLERDLLLPLADTDVVANTAAVLSNKLLQLSNGAIYDEDRNVHEVHDSKLQALEDIVEASNGQPILVFYNFKHDLSRIQAKFKQAKTLETSEDIKKWNEGKLEMLLAHPASAGHGLNLQDGGNIIVWFGLTWSLELYQQANARLHRQGQKRSVVIHHLVAKGTMDEDVMAALEKKEVNQNSLLEAVKARIETYKEDEGC